MASYVWPLIFEMRLFFEPVISRAPPLLPDIDLLFARPRLPKRKGART
jgi:hypothetical protein